MAGRASTDAGRGSWGPVRRSVRSPPRLSSWWTPAFLVEVAEVDNGAALGGQPGRAISTGSPKVDHSRKASAPLKRSCLASSSSRLAQTPLQGPLELGHLGPDGVVDRVQLGDEEGVVGPQQPDHGVDDGPVLEAALPPGQGQGGGAAQQPAGNVAGPFVARPDPLGHDRHRRPHMVGDDPVVPVGLARLAQHLLDRGHDRGEEVRLVEVVEAVEGQGDPLQARAGVDALERQRAEPPVEALVVDHEHAGVPDLDVAVGVERAARAVRLAVGVAGVEEHLRARTAGPGVAGRPPEVVSGGLTDDVVGRHADPGPGPLRLLVGLHPQGLVAFVHGDVQLRTGRSRTRRSCSS